MVVWISGVVPLDMLNLNRMKIDCLTICGVSLAGNVKLYEVVRMALFMPFKWLYGKVFKLLRNLAKERFTGN